MFARPFHVIALSLCCLVPIGIVGCGGNKKRHLSRTATAPATSGTGGTNTTTTTNPTPTTFDLASPASTNTETLAVADVVALVVEFTANGQDDVELASIAVTASGSTDESLTLGELKVVGDDNKNALLDTGEPTLATVAAPAFPTNDATVTITLANPITIAAGASLQLLIVVDASPAAANALSHVGETIALEITAASDVSATINATVTTANANFPIPGYVATLYVHDHLLISEIVRTGTADEYIELYNPTGKPIDLTDVYVTDVTHSTTPFTFSYTNLPTGTGFASPSSADFFARFPAGATVDPGQAITIAMDGALFEGIYSQAADYCLRNPSGGSVSMLGADTANPPNWAAPAAGITGGLTNAGEPVIVFRWDGTSDLVQDVDYVYYGTESSTNTRIEKGPTLSIDGPDANTNPSTYLADTPTFNQAAYTPANAPNNAIVRIDFTEGGETRTGSNGERGHDETSEPFDVTFANGAPTPGAP